MEDYHGDYVVEGIEMINVDGGLMNNRDELKITYFHSFTLLLRLKCISCSCVI